MENKFQNLSGCHVYTVWFSGPAMLDVSYEISVRINREKSQEHRFVFLFSLGSLEKRYRKN